jgi:hypothetical protein
MLKTFTYSYLNILNITQELDTYFNNNQKPDIPFKILNLKDTLSQLPNIRNWLYSNRAFPATVAFTTIPPNSSTAIHTDAGPVDLAINFPLYNCAVAKTFFYKCDPAHYELAKSVSGLPYYSMPQNHSSEICYYILTQPVILNLKVPHAVINDTDDYRHCLTFRFIKDPVHLI